MTVEQLAKASHLERYRRVRARSLRLASSLSVEDQQIQAFAYASPTKWHLAHTTWFFETFVIHARKSRAKPFDPAFALLFNSYYEGVGPRFERSQRGVLSRPSLATVHRYRQAIDEAMLALLASDEVETWWPRIELGLQHEEQHQELMLTDILANLSVHPNAPAWREENPPASVTPPPAQWLEFEAQLTTIGHTGATFCFDNETPHHRVYLEPFSLRSTLVSNAEVIAFLRDGGYQRPNLWLADGIAWVRQHGIEAPAYWRRHDEDAWSSFTLYGERPIDPSAPATHLSAYEADAIATWLNARLPTEEEWECAALSCGGSPQHGRWLEDGPVMPRTCEASQVPERSRALVGLWGETWEWTRSAYLPYPGFRPLAGQVGEYNGKFMANQWVLRGGSCATAPDHVRATYRNFFYPHERWQFTGLRLARDVT